MRERATLAWIGVFVVLGGVIVSALALRAPVADDRAQILAARLRCPVCQSESVADSPSPTARTMRAQIEDFVAQGRSDAWILDHYVDRYGTWVLLDPPVRADTVALWALPVLVVVGGVAAVARLRARAAPTPLTDTDRRQVQRDFEQWSRERASSGGEAPS